MSQKDTDGTPGYAERYAYLLWVRAAGRMYPEGDNDVERGAGVTRQWIQKWRRLNQAPNDRILTRALVRFMNEPYGWNVEEWLLDGAGEPPRPELWDFWVKARTQARAREAAEKRPVPLAPVTPRPNPRGSAAKPVGKKRRTG